MGSGMIWLLAWMGYMGYLIWLLAWSSEPTLQKGMGYMIWLLVWSSYPTLQGGEGTGGT